MTENLKNSLITESENLQKQINTLLEQEKFAISDIVSVYYQTMNVKSMMVVLRNNSNVPQNIHDLEKTIQKNFNNLLHPKILSYLNETISEYMNDLKANKRKEKTKDIIENEAKLYEELRQLMSTKEFVEQYDKGMI